MKATGLHFCRLLAYDCFEMDASIWIAIISATAGLITASVTYAITKRREREADWRKLKLEMYREFTLGVAGIAGRDATDENKKRFNTASNALHLIGSKEVVRALHAFRLQISERNTDRSIEAHDLLLSILFWEIRGDLGTQPTREPREFEVNCIHLALKVQQKDRFNKSVVGSLANPKFCTRRV